MAELEAAEQNDEIARMFAVMAKDAKIAARDLGPRGARWLVDLYYQMQDGRVRGSNQVRALTESGEPARCIEYFVGQSYFGEAMVKTWLQQYATAHLLGRWAMGLHGVGPVIAAGVCAHVDAAKCQTPGQLMAFAGLIDPARQPWAKGQKRPWCSAMKQLWFFFGQSCVKFRGYGKSLYGAIYEYHRQREQQENEAGMNAERAAAQLAAKKYGADTQARGHLEGGKLPPDQINKRAIRRAASMWMHHVWYVARRDKGLPVCRPYVIEHLGHAHEIRPPNIIGWYDDTTMPAQSERDLMHEHMPRMWARLAEGTPMPEWMQQPRDVVA